MAAVMVVPDAIIPGVDDESGPANPRFEAAYQEAIQHIKKLVNVAGPDGEPKYADIPEFLEDYFKDPTDLAAFKGQIIALEARCCRILGFPDVEPFMTTVPAAPPAGKKGGVKPKVTPLLGRLYQLGFIEAASMKGASNMRPILDIIRTNIAGDGNQTSKYPIEVLYQLMHPGKWAVSVGWRGFQATHMLLCVHFASHGVFHSASGTPTWHQGPQCQTSLWAPPLVSAWCWLATWGLRLPSIAIG